MLFFYPDKNGCVIIFYCLHFYFFYLIKYEEIQGKRKCIYLIIEAFEISKTNPIYNLTKTSNFLTTGSWHVVAKLLVIVSIMSKAVY